MSSINSFKSERSELGNNASMILRSNWRGSSQYKFYISGKDASGSNPKWMLKSRHDNDQNIYPSVVVACPYFNLSPACVHHAGGADSRREGRDGRVGDVE